MAAVARFDDDETAGGARAKGGKGSKGSKGGSKAQHNKGGEGLGKKKKSGGGAFETMGLSHNVYLGVTRKGYKVPTPIQRRTIPLIMAGQDVVAMARTGSGKTAAFLVPLLERLKVHSAMVGSRALVLSPTRELALQTYRFAKDLSKYTDLRILLVIGGDSMDEQFSGVHSNPDIIIATPGRFLHLVVEMELSLSMMEYVVFDEADQLYELGFAEQLEEILSRLPPGRQTLLFSATLPKLLVDFAKAGLSTPTLVRLDVETKLSEQLRTQYLATKRQDKLSVLMHVLKNVIKRHSMTVVFCATKHHIEYLRELLPRMGISCTYSYSSLDPAARKINVAKFRAGKVSLLLVTDVAARGIDIPMLDYVINYDFPAKPKLFVHRVGRVARAGRSGDAISLISPDEVPLLIDLHVFLGRKFKVATSTTSLDEDGVYGRVPQSIIDAGLDQVKATHDMAHDLNSLHQSMLNGYARYDRTRPQPSAQSVTRAKQLDGLQYHMHPVFRRTMGAKDLEREDIIKSLSSYKPKETVLEINKHTGAASLEAMTEKRRRDERFVRDPGERRAELLRQAEWAAQDTAPNRVTLEQSTLEDVAEAFSAVIAPGRNKSKLQEHRRGGDAKSSRSGAADGENDEDFYIPYASGDAVTEHALAVNSGAGFMQEAARAELTLEGDDSTTMHTNSKLKTWDRRRKRYVGPSNDKKMIRTEGGNKIPATYQSRRYKDWADKHNTDRPVTGQEEDTSTTRRWFEQGKAKRRGWHVTKDQAAGGDGAPSGKRRKDGHAGGKAKQGGELRSKDKILKDRMRKSREQEHHTKSRKTKAMSGKRGGKH